MPREHDTFRLSRTTNTPEPTRAEVVRFKKLVVPTQRPRRMVVGDQLTVADVLETRADECWLRRFYYSPDRKRLGVFPVSCGKWHCPTCVIGNLVKYVAPAWAYWHRGVRPRGPIFTQEDEGGWVRRDRSEGVQAVEVFELADQYVWRKYREREGIALQGEAAVPGLLVLPAWSGARRVFLPGKTGLRDGELDTTLLAAVRALPVVDPEATAVVAREPHPNFRTVPHSVTEGDLLLAADAAGVELRPGARGRRWDTPPGTTTQEQADVFRDVLLAR